MSKYQRHLWLSIAFVIPLGLATKFYRGVGQSWLNDAFGGIPYEIFWMLLVAVIWPRLPPTSIAIAVFVATSLIEFLQLWQPPWL